jgi:hypothetical protein
VSESLWGGILAPEIKLGAIFRKLAQRYKVSDTKYKRRKLAAPVARTNASRMILRLSVRVETRKTISARASENAAGWEHQTAAAPMNPNPNIYFEPGHRLSIA